MCLYLVHDYTLYALNTGSPCYSVIYYNYISSVQTLLYSYSHHDIW